jgi:hypothetical protein
MRNYTRGELLALTPDRYLASGYLDDNGQPRRELVTDYATAAATQLLAAELPAQELTFTYEALRFVLPNHDGPPRERARAALAEALETVTRMTRQTKNEGLVRWLDSCVAGIRQPADIDALLQHVQAVLRLYTLIAAIPEGEPLDGSSVASSPEPSSP